MMQDSGLSSQQTTHISEATNTPKAEITETYAMFNVKEILMIPYQFLCNYQSHRLRICIFCRYGTPGAPSMTIYAAQDSLTDSTSSQNVCESATDMMCRLSSVLQTYNPEELSIQNYEAMSGFQENDSEEPIGTDHVPVQSIINELQKLLESRGVSTLPPFSLNFPSTSGCTSGASTFKGMHHATSVLRV